MTRRVLYISPLPPPAGGIANWTRILFERGLGTTWQPSLVDTRSRTPVFASGLQRLHIDQPARWMRILRETTQALRRDAPDLMHLNVDARGAGLIRDTLCARLSNRYAVPYVVHYRGLVSSLTRKPASGAQRRRLRRLAAGAALNIVLNDADLAFIRNEVQTHAGPRAHEMRGGTRVVKLPNYFDEREITHRGVVADADDTRRQVLYVGALTRAKGAQRLIAAASQLPEADFRLLGRHYDETAQAVSNAPANVTAPGEVSHADVVTAMAKAHVLALPTTHDEGFPNVICEAMASGLPVVANPAGAISEMVDEGAGGVLLPDQHVDSLVAGLRLVLANETLRKAMSQHNADKAHREYSYSHVMPQLIALYDQIIAGRQTAV